MVDQKLPRHRFWGAGEPNCPPDLKAPNGELHTMRCKVCGDGWRKSVDVCFGAADLRMLPVRPTPEMEAAGNAAIIEGGCLAKDVWAAMVGAYGVASVAEAEQPVAWMQIGVGPLHEGERIPRLTKPKDWNPEWWRFEPLYAHPSGVAPSALADVPNDPECTCGSTSKRAYDHKLSCPHSTPWNDRVKARLSAAGVKTVDGGQA